MSDINDPGHADRASFDKNRHFTFGAMILLIYFPEDYLYAVLFGGMISINYWHVIKILMVFLEKIPILCSEARLKDP
jgi:hypothetical protein